MYRPFLFAALAAASVVLSAPVRADGAALRAVLEAVSARDWDTARTRAAAEGRTAADIVEWHRLRAGEGTWEDYRAFLARNPDWPGLPYLADKGEAAIPEDATPETVAAYFDGHTPGTGEGLMRLARALEALGRGREAEDRLVAGWGSLLLGSDEQAALLARYGRLLAPHHIARLDAMLWRGASSNARAMLALVPPDWARLAEARIALRDDASGVDALIAAVPAALADDPGLAFERFNWRARKGRNEDAIALLLERSTSAAALGQPERWAGWRAALARWAMRENRTTEAYRLASAHFLTEGSDYAELEWLAGFIALRRQQDADRALGHFRAFRISVGTPISLGRAGYWEGRALEAKGDAEGARLAYEFGAHYQTSFYGLLAAEKAGLPMDASLATGGPDFPDWQGARFASSTVLAAAMALAEAGDQTLATRFFLHLAESLDATELGQLSDLALALDQPYAAISIAKQAAERAVILPRAYFPLTDLAQGNHGVPTELVLAIARRESEFNHEVVSHAGARGLMQVMPGTARDMAAVLQVDYSLDRLTADPAYNARLGAAYLARLIDEFGPQWVLVAAGYNAGPGRPRRWVEERGHPNSAGVDAIDWIEMIPFTETRNYVMRVTESLAIYRARLSGRAQPLRLSQELKGG